MAINRTPVQAPTLNPIDTVVNFPFGGPDFQQKLIKVLMLDDAGELVMEHIKASYFETPELRWIYSEIHAYWKAHAAMPTWMVLKHRAQTAAKLDIRPTVLQMLSYQEALPVKEEEWIRTQVLEWVKQKVFQVSFKETKALWERGQRTEAMDHMLKSMDKLNEAIWQKVDRGWFFEELPFREAKRLEKASISDAIVTGINELDAVLDGGLSLGELGIWIAYAKGGKALRDDQSVRTPSGWVPISKLSVGDLVSGGSSGKPQKVTGVFPQGIKDLFEVIFSDGAKVIASTDHVWTVQTRKTELRRNVGLWIDVSTQDLRELLNETQVWVPNTPVVEGGGSRLPLDPYLLGLLLGDGGLTGNTIRFHKPERDLWKVIQDSVPEGDEVRFHEADDYVSICGETCGSITASILKSLGLMGLKSKDKFIPDVAFTASTKDRFDLLCGLCDTDGYVTHTGCAIEFSSASYRMATGVVDLVRSLGGYASLREKIVNGVVYWMVRLRLLDGRMPVKSAKNVAKVKVRTTNKRRRIVAINPVPPASCTCITVDDPNHLFITEGYIVTHNSTNLINHGAMAIRAQMAEVLHIPLEGSRALIENRYEAWFADDLYSGVKKGGMSPDKYGILWNEYQFLKRKLVVRAFTENWTYTALDIEAEIKDLRKHHAWSPKMVIVDYGDLMHGRGGPYQAPWMSERDAFRDLKLLANKGFAVWTASQAQRPTDKNWDVKEALIKTSMIAGGIEKVRVCDFVGSINQTTEEKTQGVARLYAEMYRDNEAGKVIQINTEMSKMKMGVGIIKPPSASVGGGMKPPSAFATNYSTVAG